MTTLPTLPLPFQPVLHDLELAEGAALDLRTYLSTTDITALTRAHERLSRAAVYPLPGRDAFLEAFAALPHVSAFRFRARSDLRGPYLDRWEVQIDGEIFDPEQDWQASDADEVISTWLTERLDAVQLPTRIFRAIDVTALLTHVLEVPREAVGAPPAHFTPCALPEQAALLAQLLCSDALTPAAEYQDDRTRLRQLAAPITTAAEAAPSDPAQLHTAVLTVLHAWDDEFAATDTPEHRAAGRALRRLLARINRDLGIPVADLGRALSR